MEQDYNKLVAWILGVVLVLVGILGFVPGLVMNGALLGIFEVNSMHNIVHLVTGGVLVVAAAVDTGRNARLVNMVLGVVYLLVAVLGFVAAGVLEGMGIVVNMADHLLHAALGVVLLGTSLAVKETTPIAAARM